MKKFAMLLSAFAAVTPLMAQTEEATEQVVATAPLGETVLTIFVGVVALAASLAILAHMIYDNFIRKSYNERRTVADFVNLRRAAKLADSSTEEEIAYVNSRLDEMVAAWGAVTDSEGKPAPYPLKKAGVKLATLVMAEAEAAMPTDEATVERLNGYAAVLNNALERRFNGSKALIITTIIVAIILAIITKSATSVIPFAVGLVIYWLASRTSTFVLVRQELKNGGAKRSFLSRVIGGLFAGVAAAKTYKTVTTYSDGSQTTDIDDTETWMSLAFTLIVIVVLAMFIWLFSIINYLRNYVFYI
jgi:hypothetical protein